MAEYIKRIDAMNICRGYSEHCFHTNDSRGQDIADRIEDDIVELPTADVVEVKHGEWIDKENPRWRAYDIRHCSNCGWNIPKNNLRKKDLDWSFCPKCRPIVKREYAKEQREIAKIEREKMKNEQ